MKVTVDQTMDFAEQWKSDGIFVAHSPAAIQFATDWANICIVSLLEMISEKARQKREAATKTIEGQASSVVLTGADS